MNKPAPRVERMHRRFGGWNLPSVVLGMLLVAAVLWLLPRRVREVVLVDGADRWAAAEAPPRRQILWRPAESIDVGGAEGGGANSLVRPQLADGGLSLYYTLKRPDAEADIYRSRFDDGRWLPGEPVAELNSPAGDYGPVLSADGRSLFLYSDRPGGQGGYDLFVSRRTADGWSEPVNLGPTVNTPAHEYDPAISPDGTRLFFASNRTPEMVRRLAAAAAAGTPPTWNATLRADIPLQQFDIHSAAYDAVADGWKAAIPLPGINAPTSNEGEPCISPDGAFLYFTSDRPNASGAVPNYDVYRVRLAAPGLAAVETLGAGVNTAANEHDPAFSPEGFRLVFSSDRDGRVAPHPDRYGLYASLATETFDASGWSTAHLSPLARHWWWIVLLRCSPASRRRCCGTSATGPGVGRRCRCSSSSPSSSTSSCSSGRSSFPSRASASPSGSSSGSRSSSPPRYSWSRPQGSRPMPRRPSSRSPRSSPSRRRPSRRPHARR